MELFKQNMATAEKAEDNKLPLSIKCASCGKQSLAKLVYLNGSVCPFCDGLMRMPARDRVDMIADAGTFTEMGKEKASTDPLDFPQYQEKLKKGRDASGLVDAIITGTCEIEGYPCGLGALDSYFIMGSMGAVVGEKICDLAETCLKKHIPLVLFAASGGARMQEGMVSLLQMTRTTMAINKLGEAGLVFISVLTDPTSGGVTASFAMQGDVILAEPKAFVGFAGPRVINQTVNEELPEEFQTSEYMLKQGMIDAIVERKEMKPALGQILSLHAERSGETNGK